jgi:O-antigen ligase
MTNIYTFLRNVFQDIKHENKINPTFGFVILILIAIPMLLILSSVFVGILVILTAYFFKKSDFNLNKKLLLPILLYALMVVSLFWTIDSQRTISSLVKELPLLIIPLCFLCFKPFSEIQKQKIIQYYSYGIVFLSVFYLIKALIRYIISHDSTVFFYHELVTKEVNAIHVSVYVAIAFFYFFTKSIKKPIDYVVLTLLFTMVFLLSSKNIIVVFVGLMVVYHLFYSKLSKKMRLKNLLIVVAVLFLLPFVGKIKERFRQEYQTIMVDNSVNDVINKNGTVYNVSIKQAWTQEKFQPNNFFPGTAFRVYQFRIFLELMQENNIFWNGFGLDASYKKIEQKGIDKNVYLGVGADDGYQKKNFHNQYVQNFAELGVFGFLILIAMLFVNLKNGIANKNFIQIAFGVMMISLFLTETFLWRQRGVMFFTIMYCIFNSDVKKSFSKTIES